ncbi:hypothetical protein DOK76_12570 [Vagococcus sp. DIV0080]|uniref:Phage protein n=1 Tax=Candidatus Vagococcus giribetii TaxID=2230876 RepID=A0ABS3HVY3_9ENTE|nr:hypothetical protein [Vagococcus sp. DIV0080]MBO0477908.1 hypothetical protein [Vagococcus sp. DIV0080]
MIEIKFKVFTSYFEDEDELKGEYGYFQLCVDDKTYGEYREDIELDILSMNIYDWFSNFAQACILLKNKNIVYISDVETSEVWIKLMTDGEDVQISEIYADKPDGSRSVETDINLDEKNRVWEKMVKVIDFQSELFLKGEQYLSELKKSNSETNEYIQKLEMQLKEIK